MLNIIGRKLSQITVPIGEDEVISAYPIPQNGRLNQVNLDIRLIGGVGVALGMEKVVLYGIDGYVVPVTDPDATLPYDTAWDRFVPKDDAVGVSLNLDTLVPDTSPVYEEGHVDINAMFDMVGLAPREIFRRRRMLSFADMGPTVGSQAVDTWTPGESFQTVVKQRVRVNQPSYVLFGLSSPALTATSTSIWVPPVGAQQWAILQYMEKFLEDAFIQSLEMVETGAETPYVESESYIQRMLEDIIFETTADAFHPQQWNVFTASTFNVTVPGRLSVGRTLTSEGG